MITPMWMSSRWTITAYTGYRSASVEVISADLTTSTSNISICSLVATIPEKRVFLQFRGGNWLIPGVNISQKEQAFL